MGSPWVNGLPSKVSGEGRRHVIVSLVTGLLCECSVRVKYVHCVSVSGTLRVIQ